jgi:hypothetical protein
VALAVRDTDGAAAPARAGWGKAAAWFAAFAAAITGAAVAWRFAGGAA